MRFWLVAFDYKGASRRWRKCTVILPAKDKGEAIEKALAYIEGKEGGPIQHGTGILTSEITSPREI